MDPTGDLPVRAAPSAPISSASEPAGMGPGSGPGGAPALRGSGRRAIILLLLLPVAPALPAPWAALALGALGGAWLALSGRRIARRERRAVALLLLAATLTLAAGALATVVAGARGPGLGPAAEARYAALWEELRALARDGAAALPPPGEGEAFRRAAFARLHQRWERRASAGDSLLLVDPDGEAVAWAGEGLVNEPSAEALPRAGLDFFAGFGSVSLVAVEPLDDTRRPWRVVAGRSVSADRWPFRPPAFLGPEWGTLRWSLATPETADAPGAIRLAVPGVPSFVALPTGSTTPPPGWHQPGPRIAWGLLAILLLGLGALRAVRIAVPYAAGVGPPTERRESLGPGLLCASGALALALAAGAGPDAAFALAGGGALLAMAVARPLRAPAGGGQARGTPGATIGLPEACGGATALLLVIASLGYQAWRGPLDLATGLFPGTRELALPGGLVLAALAGLVLFRRPLSAGRNWDRWAWIGLGTAIVGVVAQDLLPLAICALVVTGGAAARWVSGRPLRSPTTIAVAVLLAALVAATAWETAYRRELKATLATVSLAGLAPPGSDEMAVATAQARRHLRGLDLATVVPREPAGLDPEDLAFVLWRRSPLARPNVLSALSIAPLTQPAGGAPSMFSYGPPVAGTGGRDWDVTGWEQYRLPVWDATLATGEETLTYDGRPWALARWWLLPRPGFGLALQREREALDAGLLRGGPAAGRRIEGLPGPALYALYAADRRALVSAWPEAPPLPASLAEAPRGELWATLLSAAPASWVGAPSGPAWAWARRGADGVEVLYLPVLLPGPALDRAGTHALGGLMVFVAGAGLLLLLALPRPGFRALAGRTLRSYSKRLIIVLTTLLLVPLVILNLVILSDAEDRLGREQRAAGSAALASAQWVIGDIVTSMEPGAELANQVDDTLLMWLSRVLHHEVNLYWGSSMWASSKPELFAAGLLPERIPGEIFSRLTLEGYDEAARTTRTRGISYLELYAPLPIPGPGVGQKRFFLSLPLLTQQEEVARELALLRRRVILASAALFGLLIAVSIGLARRFSRPLEELVEGTRRIAAGAPSLDLAPTELELAALVEAVDQMAGRIATSRARLVREKEVVERIVENVTSGVVSLDADGRVLMYNRIARELLGVEAGEPLAAALARQERLLPVAEFVAGVGAELERATVKLSGGDDLDEREWSLVWVPAPGEGEPAALLVVEDATEVLRGQRLLAWAEMARIIAHEIKNPLTPLRLSAEHLREVHRGGGRGARYDEVFERCTVNILRQVEELRTIASEFSTFSSIPKIDPRPGDLVGSMAGLVEAYRGAATQGVSVRMETTEASLAARFDGRLLGRAVRNLIENAVRAAATRGGEIVVRVERQGERGRIAVADTGPGVPPDLLGRIFDPNFSTHDTGTGLGLPIARRIAEEHGGAIAASNRPEGGLEVAITIPL